MSLNLEDAEKRYGAPVSTVHRVDLHNELLRLAATDEVENARKVDLRLSSKVVGANAQEGSITLADGSVHFADLIVAGDGVHSVLRNVVLGEKAPGVTTTGLSAFRFLIPTKELEGDEQLVEFLRRKCKGPLILADTKETEKEKHIVWYDCRGYAIQMLNCLRESR